MIQENATVRWLPRLSTIVLFVALIATGLSVGFFYGWQVSVIPGLRVVNDTTYIQTMNGVNANIRNLGFGFAFFGSFVLLLLALISRARQWRSLTFVLIAGALVVYLVGVLMITFGIHVPMNVELLTLTDLSGLDIGAIRLDYEGRWNSWHLTRTYAAVVTFVLLLGAVFAERRLPQG